MPACASRRSEARADVVDEMVKIRCERLDFSRCPSSGDDEQLASHDEQERNVHLAHNKHRTYIMADQFDSAL